MCWSDDVRWLKSDQSLLESIRVCVVSLNLILLSGVPSLPGNNFLLPVLSMDQLGLHVGVPGGRFGRKTLSSDASQRQTGWPLGALSQSYFLIPPPFIRQWVWAALWGAWPWASGSLQLQRSWREGSVSCGLWATCCRHHWLGNTEGACGQHFPVPTAGPAPGPEITRLKSLCVQKAQTS